MRPRKPLLVRRLSITFLPAVFILTAIAAVSVIYQIPPPIMTRDVAAIANVQPHTGLLSNLGVLLWCATFTLCLFAALMLRKISPREIFRFFLSSALLSMYLLLDDLFLIHEWLVPHYVGISQEIVYLLLALAVLSYLVVFRKIILRTDYYFLLAALGMFAASLVIDVFLEVWLSWWLDDWVHFFEDGAKWLGIASWCSYYAQTAFYFIADSLGRRGKAVHFDTSA